jgi:hypothetical protein
LLINQIPAKNCVILDEGHQVTCELAEIFRETRIQAFIGENGLGFSRLVQVEIPSMKGGPGMGERNHGNLMAYIGPDARLV